MSFCKSQLLALLLVCISIIIEASTPGDPEEFSCLGKPNGLYPNPVDCRSFYRCSNGATYMYNCPADLHFHPERLECLFPHEVPYCGRNTTTPNPPTEAPTMSTENPEEFSCDDKPYGDYAHASNCTLFYRCNEGEKQLLQCPATLAFNPVLQMCDLEDNVPSCRKQTIAPSTEEPMPEPTTEPTPEPTTAPAPEPTTAPGPEPTTAPGPEPTTAPGPEPTTKPAERTTEPAPQPTTESVPEPTTEEPENTTRDSGEFTCDGLPDAIYPNPKDCSTFYKCRDGIAYLYDCPSDLLFDRIILNCISPELARCA